MVVELLRAVRDPGAFFRFQPFERQQAYWRVAKTIIDGVSPGRRRAYEQVMARPAQFAPIAASDGFTLLSGPDMRERTAGACRAAAGIVKGSDLAALRRQSKKPYLVKLLNASSLTADSPIVQLAFDPEVVRLAAGYLGCLPTITYIDIWYSPNDGGSTLDGSQLFHLDHEDFLQLKCFVYIEDIDEACGPLRVLNAAASSRLARRLDYRTTEQEKRVADDQFASEPVATATGPRGSMLMVDTSRCFHAGSRGGGKPRFSIVYQYLTPYAFVRRTYRSRIPRIAGAERLHPAAHHLLSF